MGHDGLYLGGREMRELGEYLDNEPEGLFGEFVTESGPRLVPKFERQARHVGVVRKWSMMKRSGLIPGK